jgi:hypothetical protein
MKNTTKKNVSTATATAQKKAAAASKANAKKTAQPGIIAFIMETLIAAREQKKPVTANDILTRCAKKFPSRTAAGMSVTVRAQLSRLPYERKFDIVKQRGIEGALDNRTVYYAAGATAKPGARRVAAA